MGPIFIGPDMGYDPILGMTRYREIPDIGYYSTITRHRAYLISGYTRYRVLNIIHDNSDDIGYNIRIYGYRA
jgi:hypothetical protein